LEQLGAAIGFPLTQAGFGAIQDHVFVENRSEKALSNALNLIQNTE
jgi:hypothetical protein